jgi:transcriptional regulator with XRE-family HTH domain
MTTIDVYLDSAKAKLDLKTDSALARRLEVNPSMVTEYRQGTRKPSDVAMLRLAALAGMDQERALLDLNSWRAPEPARACYQRIARKLARITVVAALLLIGISQTSQAVDYRPMATSECRIVYIMESVRRWIRALRAAFGAPLPAAG